MFPNSPNTHLTLLNIKSTVDEIGNQAFIVFSQKEIFGITRSITQSEYQTSVMINTRFDFKVIIQAILYDGSKYAKIKNKLYKIERTYLNGQFIELYLSSSDVEVVDL